MNDYLEQEGNNVAKLRIRTDEELTRIVRAMEYKDQVLICSLMDEFYEPLLARSKKEYEERIDLYHQEIDFLKKEISNLKEARGLVLIGDTVIVQGSVASHYQFYMKGPTE